MRVCWNVAILINKLLKQFQSLLEDSEFIRDTTVVSLGVVISNY